MQTAERQLNGASVLTLIGGHLATAPRAQKEARAVRDAGGHAIVRGTWWSDALAAEDAALARELDVDFAAVADLRPSARGRNRLRLRQKIARELYERAGVVSGRSFGTAAPELLRAARDAGADITIAHSEAGLWVAKELLRDGRRVGVDFEDWFSRDLPRAERAGRPTDALHDCERELLARAHCCTATTSAMARALAADAGTDRIPVVVPNAFPASDRDAALRGVRDPRPAGSVSFHWFSQTIGPGRGLETLAQALSRVHGNWHLTLRGALDRHTAWFDRTFRVFDSRVVALDPVPNRELLSRTMSHDVGLALEEPSSENKMLTASNKLFEYLRAGLAVIATRTEGQEEAMALAPGAGALIEPSDPEALAAAMQQMIDDRTLLCSRRQHAVRAAETTCAWESHAGRLIDALSVALRVPLARQGPS